MVVRTVVCCWHRWRTYVGASGVWIDSLAAGIRARSGNRRAFFAFWLFIMHGFRAERP